MTCSRAGARHDMRDAVPPCGMRRRGEAGRRTRRRLRNNPPDEEDPPEQTITTTFTPHVFKTTPEQPSGNCTLRARIVIMARVGGRGMLRVGLLGRSGAGACPNLLQRHPGPGSAARRSAEYQRFFSGTPARSGPLQQIWTNGAATGPGRGVEEGYSAGVWSYFREAIL